MPPPPVLTRWNHHEPPTADFLAALLLREGLVGEEWANEADYIYPSHEHDYDKVIYCIEGSIQFVMGHTAEKLTLHPGDRLELPATWPHHAVVGLEGVRCLEAHRS
jgi:quercetin dioxygenase-like cupin family protein